MHQFNRTYTTPFHNSIPNYIGVHLKKISFKKRLLKYLRRRLYILIRGQSNLEVFEILEVHKKILWINMSAPSLGDSLMDLSSRALLKDKQVDLFTDKKNSHIYDFDFIFQNIYTNVKKVPNLNYDLVIIDSFSTRSIRIKSYLAKKTPYVGIFGYFNGPEVNRILFSFFQMNNLLGNIRTENEIKTLAKNIISISKKDEEIVSNIVPNHFISFVLGGEWEYKTYASWDEVIRKIIKIDKEIFIVFLGSKNANEIAKKILNKFPNHNIFNFIDKLSFNQSAGVIKKSKVVFCCDGGLMHAANAVNTKNISLFARLTPEMLITKKADTIQLYDNMDVNNISSEAVFLKYCEISNFSDNHRLDE
jgi:ADP-heptose:LPS heptosyltransferase